MNLKKLTALMLALLMFVLAGCTGEKDPLAEQLYNGPWIADFSEGTKAGYTFHKDGSFDCDTTITVEGKTGSLRRSGSWEIQEQDGLKFVILQYPDVTYSSQIVCTLTDDGNYSLELAGSILHQ